MFIGIVIIILIICLSLLTNIYSYILSFHKNFSELNNYYTTRYAAISSIEYGLTTWTNIESLWDYLWIDDLIISSEYTSHEIKWVAELLWQYRKVLHISK